MPTRSDLLSALAQQAQACDVFASISTTSDTLVASARPGEVSAHYYVQITGSHEAQVGLRSADRWVSESIEADLMHTGDSLDELLEDELVDLGNPLQLTVEHYRDDNKLYTFCSKVSWSDDVQAVALLLAVLRAYEATFRQLGDLKPEED